MKKKIKEMSEKHLPKKGFTAKKDVNVSDKQTIISYIFKGDIKVLNFIYNQFVNGCGVISDDYKFEYYDMGDGGSPIILIVDDDRYPFIKNDFIINPSAFPIFDISFEMDNVLIASLDIDTSSIDNSIVKLIWVFDYIMESLVENKNKIKKYVDTTYKLVKSKKSLVGIMGDGNVLLSPVHELFLREKDLEKNKEDDGKNIYDDSIDKKKK